MTVIRPARGAITVEVDAADLLDVLDASLVAAVTGAGERLRYAVEDALREAQRARRVPPGAENWGPIGGGQGPE